MSALTAQQRRTRAPFGRRALEVSEYRDVGAYRVLTLTERAPDGRAPRELAPAPGQFYMLAARDRWGGEEDERPFLARACSVLRAREAPDDGLLLDFLLERVGPGTRRLCELREGDVAWVTGPLGVGFAVPAAGGERPVLVGGGVGIAPLASWQDELLADGASVTALLGFRDRAHAEGAELLLDAHVATDDGSVGHRGLVTDLLTAELDGGAPATVYACGPPPMLEAVRQLCVSRGVSAQLALEAGMACGFGACYGCVIRTREGGYLRVCVDGPIVDAARIESALAPGHQ